MRKHKTAPTKKAVFRVPKIGMWLIIRRDGFKINFLG
jgi:hypothetical protein